MRILKSSIAAMLFVLAVCVSAHSVSAQTTLAAGDIVFTGYSSSFGGGGTDSFSFVLLKPVTQNTVINFTNNGYTAAGTFQCTEEFAAYTVTNPAGIQAGIEITITGSTATFAAGGSAGTVTLSGTDPLGLNLATSGDQVFAYQGTITCPGGANAATFISGIHMNVYSVTTNGDCGNTTAATWDPDCAAGNGNYSKLPPGLVTGTNAFWEGIFDDFSTEHDDGKFNGCGLNLSTAAAVRTAVLNRNNWIWGDFNTSTISLPSGCNYLGIPMAADVSVSGRVVNSAGKGISKARVSMTDESGNVVYSITSPFGYYHFADLSSGQSYVVEITDKHYRFSPRVISISDELTGLDFMALP